MNIANSNPFSSNYNEDFYCSYKKVWAAFLDNAKQIIKDEYKTPCSEIVGHVLSVTETPMICLITEFCAPDSDVIFEYLTTFLKSEGDYFIVQIDSSREVTAKYLMKKTVELLLSSFETNYKEGNGLLSNDDKDVSIPSKRCKKINFSFWRLRGLCEKISHHKQIKPLLVYVISDLTDLSNEVLIDFLAGLRGLKDCINISVVFGLPTNVNFFYKLIPDKILVSYEVKVFDFKSFLPLIDNMIDEIFLKRTCNFLLHGNILDDLILSFNFYNPSVENFVRGVQACMMNHFYGCNVSFLCCPLKDVPNIVKSLTNEQVSLLLTLKSVGVLNLNNKENGKPLLEDNSNIKKELVKYMTELHCRIARFHLAVRCLYSIWKLLPHSSTLISLKNVYCKSMKHCIVKTKNFQEDFKSLPYLGTKTLLGSMQTLKTILSSSSEDDKISEITDRIDCFREEILNSKKHSESTIEDKFTSDPAENFIAANPVKNSLESSSSGNSVAENLEKTFSSSVKTSSRTDFMKSLRDNSSQYRRLSKLDKVKNEFAEFLINEFFAVFLECPIHYPFNEVLCYQNISESRNVTKVNPKGAVNRAFTCPSDILDCNCCRLKERETFHDSWPDICISYKLYLEANLQINLHDWLRSFDSLVRGDENDIPPEIYNRFLQTVNELNFIGLIKPYKKKADHVKKLKI